MTIDQFIEDQARQVNSIVISVLSSFSGRLLDKLKEDNAIEFPGLQEAVQVIIQFLESPATQQAKDPLPRWMAETGFAAGYLLKRFDLIPDQVAESGLADDVLILASARDFPIVSRLADVLSDLPVRIHDWMPRLAEEWNAYRHSLQKGEAK